MWQNWTNGILGIAVIVVAFLGLEGATHGHWEFWAQSLQS
jgi:hypothetical protein